MDTIELPYGRIASWDSLMEQFMEEVAAAPHGDYLEIGTLFGGSLICAIRARKNAGRKGRFFCVDPLDGYYGNKLDPVTRLPITYEGLLENLRHFGYEDEVTIIQKPSNPWPEELADASFRIAYIDGGHNGLDPITDWINVSQRMLPNSRVLFDNVNERWPAVLHTARIAALTMGWREAVCYQSQMSVVRND